MQSEIKREMSNQDIILKNRNKLEISGVKKIESLNNEEFVIDTTLGILIVRGEDLTMQQLEIEKGLLWITGSIYSFEYLNKDENKKEKKSFFGKLFK